jgi:nucleoside-diphosphate-sugar epimerase
VKVVVIGASGNVGTSLLATLADEPSVESVLGVVRRLPEADFPKTKWASADIVSADLVPLFHGADAVVHLAWQIQPSRDLAHLRHVNVDGSARVFDAVAQAQVPALVFASSVGAYSPGPKDRFVDESWPVDGVQTSFYSRHKAEVEKLLDRFEAEHPAVRVVRMRPGLIFKREAASGIRRLFAGPFLPSPLLHPKLLRIVPDLPRLRFQAVHSLDVGNAYRLAIVSDARGAFNLTAEPVLGPDTLSDILGARKVPVAAGIARAVVEAAYRLRLQPTPPGWLDLALAVPLLDSARAHGELGWKPDHGAGDALLELLSGLRKRDGIETAPLAPDTGGALRVRELLTGVGARER